jgi:hypothetical protein
MGGPVPKRPLPRQIVATYLRPHEIAALDSAVEDHETTRADYVRQLVISDLAKRSRASQNLPEHVEDAAALARVADLLDEAV